ncbi:MAG TPA: gamma-glutamyltransferase [Acidimicrobiales bacterium]|nr:gamma-glutamyltransferase [Acidimicrobiales bacterium]
MVASADHLASSAGLGMLRDGGSAVDAALAAGAVLAVTSPHMCGMGGDLFAVVHRPGEPVAALCAAGRAGSGADSLQLRCEGFDLHVPAHGDIRAVTIPGCVDGWLELHRRYGRLPLSQIFEPAITYAAAGFPASPLLAAIVSDVVHLHGAHDFREPTMATGGHLQTGTLIRRPGIATAMGAIVASGRSGFYQGAFGDGLVTLGAGLFKRSDLARVQAEWVEPLKIEAWGHDLWTAPPPSQGYLTLAGAAVASQLDLPDDPDDPAWAHLLSEAAREVGRDRPKVLYDGADGASLLAPERIEAQRAAVHPERRGDAPLVALPGDTTALCAVDRDRMAVSLIQSNASAWGARIIEPTTGEFLHNRAIGFTLEAGHRAEYLPDRRPPHTLSPALVTRSDGSVRAVLGTMGGDSQPQILLQVLARLLRSDASAGAVVEAPRWRLGARGFGLWDAGGPDQISVEQDASPAWETGLAERGHDVVRSELSPDHGFGHAQLVTVDGDMLDGAADPRTVTGAAAGY